MPAARMARRAFLTSALGTLAASVLGGAALAQSSRLTFPQWVERFRPRARARGVSEATYNRVMGATKPDTAVYALQRSQPEFREPMWQYVNRRVSDWRIMTGKARAVEHAALIERIETQYGVDRYLMLGLWGMESAFGDVVTSTKYMRPVIPALAALAWGEPRRRAYWEQELLNALVIIERGWANESEMVGSWAGAMGHTQWMPEVWLNMGADGNGDGRISPFGSPDDAFAGTAQYLIKRGGYRRDEGWGYEVRLPGKGRPGGMRTIAAWQKLGVTRANGQPFPRPEEQARIWQPVSGGPVFLVTQNFRAVRSYNPADSYALATVHLADRIRGEGAFVQQFPGGERIPTLEEVKELQGLLAAQGFNPGGADGRIGPETVAAVRAYQTKVGMKPVDGYVGIKVLARLRQGK
ncbi:MAG: lytic murein transglycosylase [Hyphomicrobiaceae bacterium]|jgi:peptidoglycan lytic transglycosylase B